MIAIEFLINLVMEVLIEFGIRGLPNRRQNDSALKIAIFYFLLALGLGYLSASVFPEHFINDETLRLWNLLISPVLIGFFMGYFGRWRASRGHRVIKLDSFGFGYVFALGFALSRFYLCK